MEQVVPWEALYALIEPVYYPKRREAGRRPVGTDRMLRIYFLQQWPRQMSFTDAPAPASFRIETIWVLVYRLRFIGTSWLSYPARKPQFQPVYPVGKLTIYLMIR